MAAIASTAVASAIAAPVTRTWNRPSPRHSSAIWNSVGVAEPLGNA